MFYLAYNVKNEAGEVIATGLTPVPELPLAAHSLEPIKLCDDKLKAVNYAMWSAQERGLPFNAVEAVKVRRNRAVRCNETGASYPTIAAAASAVGANRVHLSNHLRDPMQYKTVKGYTFSYYSE